MGKNGLKNSPQDLGLLDGKEAFGEGQRVGQVQVV